MKANGPFVLNASPVIPVRFPQEPGPGVQAIHAQCIAKVRGGIARGQAICVAVQECYDVLVDDLIEADGSLPEDVLRIATPHKVLELAVEVGWLGPSILDESTPEPPAGPAEARRKYLVEPAYRTWLWELLEPRAEYWRARVNAEPFGIELPKPEFVVRPLPATTAEGLLFQADAVLKEVMAKEPKKLSQRLLMETMIAAGVPPKEITVRRMLLTAAEVGGDAAVPIILINDSPRMPQHVGEGSLSAPDTPIKSDRRAAVDSYIETVLRRTGKRITRSAIWKSAGYRSRTEFERWQRNDSRTTQAADRIFTRILAGTQSSR
jgi:hypothetical protein